MLKNEIQIFISFLNLLLQNENEILFCLFSLLLLMKFKYFCLFDKMRFNLLSSSINYFKMKLFFFCLFNLKLQNEIQIVFSLFHLLFLMKFKSFLFAQLIPK